jgi:phospholipid transport system substrate-binding protein
MKNLTKQCWIICLGLFLCSYAILAKAEQSPVDMLKSVADQMIQALKQNKATLKAKPSFVYSLANRIVVPNADLDEMAKRVLPPQTWNHANSAQRKEFKREFTQLLVRTYATALADYTDQTVQFYPIRGGYQGKTTVQVNSKIVRSDGPSIPVNYRLTLKGSGWKLFDISVEGISLLESFRSQFADKLSQGNIEQLIKDLKIHNTRGE